MSKPAIYLNGISLAKYKPLRKLIDNKQILDNAYKKLHNNSIK